MEKLYFAFYAIAFILLLLDAFAGSTRRHVQTSLLPLGIAFAVLVLVIQSYKAI
jgi:hypothetical protein